MARGRRNKIFNLPLEVVSSINDAIVNGRRTYKELEDWLRGDGYDISESGLQRYGANFLKKMERISIAREQAKSIIETSAGLKTDMSEATSTVAFQLLMDMLINTDSESTELDKNTLAAIRTLATLERSTISREKLKLEYDKGVNAAIDKISEKLQKELANDPDGYNFIMKLAENSVEGLKGA